MKANQAPIKLNKKNQSTILDQPKDHTTMHPKEMKRISRSKEKKRTTIQLNSSKRKVITKIQRATKIK